MRWVPGWLRLKRRHCAEDDEFESHLPEFARSHFIFNMFLKPNPNKNTNTPDSTFCTAPATGTAMGTRGGL